MKRLATLTTVFALLLCGQPQAYGVFPPWLIPGKGEFYGNFIHQENAQRMATALGLVVRPARVTLLEVDPKTRVVIRYRIEPSGWSVWSTREK